MRRIAFLTAVAVFAFAGIAWAVTDAMTYTVTVKPGKGKPSAKTPVPMVYSVDFEAMSNPPGQQPDTSPITTVYLWKGIKQFAKYYPSCTQTQIDGKADFPAACNKAVVGTGTTQAYAGAPGNNLSDSSEIKEDLTVKAVNGNKGKQLMLVVTTVPGAPVPISNRVVPGTLKSGKGAFGLSVEFDIPADLQNQLGLSIALTSFKVSFPAKTIAAKINGKKQKVGYLMLQQKCPAAGMPVEAITQFKDANGTITPVTSDSTAKC